MRMISAIETPSAIGIARQNRIFVDAFIRLRGRVSCALDRLAILNLYPRLMSVGNATCRLRGTQFELPVSLLIAPVLLLLAIRGRRESV